MKAAGSALIAALLAISSSAVHAQDTVNNFPLISLKKGPSFALVPPRIKGPKPDNLYIQPNNIRNFPLERGMLVRMMPSYGSECDYMFLSGGIVEAGSPGGDTQKQIQAKTVKTRADNDKKTCNGPVDPFSFLVHVTDNKVPLFIAPNKILSGNPKRPQLSRGRVENNNKNPLSYGSEKNNNKNPSWVLSCLTLQMYVGSSTSTKPSQFRHAPRSADCQSNGVGESKKSSWFIIKDPDLKRLVPILIIARTEKELKKIISNGSVIIDLASSSKERADLPDEEVSEPNSHAQLAVVRLSEHHAPKSNSAITIVNADGTSQSLGKFETEADLFSEKVGYWHLREGRTYILRLPKAGGQWRFQKQTGNLFEECDDLILERRKDPFSSQPQKAACHDLVHQVTVFVPKGFQLSPVDAGKQTAKWSQGFCESTTETSPRSGSTYCVSLTKRATKIPNLELTDELNNRFTIDGYAKPQQIGLNTEKAIRHAIANGIALNAPLVNLVPHTVTVNLTGSKLPKSVTDVTVIIRTGNYDVTEKHLYRDDDPALEFKLENQTSMALEDYNTVLFGLQLKGDGGDTPVFLPHFIGKNGHKHTTFEDQLDLSKKEQSSTIFTAKLSPVFVSLAKKLQRIGRMNPDAETQDDSFCTLGLRINEQSSTTKQGTAQEAPKTGHQIYWLKNGNKKGESLMAPELANTNLAPDTLIDIFAKPANADSNGGSGAISECHEGTSSPFRQVTARELTEQLAAPIQVPYAIPLLVYFDRSDLVSERVYSHRHQKVFEDWLKTLDQVASHRVLLVRQPIKGGTWITVKSSATGVPIDPAVLADVPISAEWAFNLENVRKDAVHIMEEHVFNSAGPFDVVIFRADGRPAVRNHEENEGEVSQCDYETWMSGHEDFPSGSRLFLIEDMEPKNKDLPRELACIERKNNVSITTLSTFEFNDDSDTRFSELAGDRLDTHFHKPQAATRTQP